MVQELMDRQQQFQQMKGSLLTAETKLSRQSECGNSNKGNQR
jgi:hypothetical protein